MHKYRHTDAHRHTQAHRYLSMYRLIYLFVFFYSFILLFKGIWIGRKVIEHPLRSGENVTVVFLDSEGIGSTDSKDTTDATDNQIFTLSVLISSLLIYNSKNVPNNTDLEKLQ